MSQMPILRMQELKKGWEHQGLRLVWCKWPHKILCVQPVSTRTHGSGVFACLPKIQDNPSNIIGFVSQGPISYLICVSSILLWSHYTHFKVEKMIPDTVVERRELGDPHPPWPGCSPLSLVSEVT